MLIAAPFLLFWPLVGGIMFLALVTLGGGRPRQEDDAHGSARFARRKELKDLLGAKGLLIGRDEKGRLLRYAGPAHLLTMAPTRSGKGVGAIIPNLLTAKRPVICICSERGSSRVMW